MDKPLSLEDQIAREREHQIQERIDYPPSSQSKNNLPTVFDSLGSSSSGMTHCSTGVLPPLKLAQIERSFTYHSPKPGQAERYTRLREAAKAFAYLIVELTPESREQSLALTDLEYATYNANAAIARNE